VDVAGRRESVGLKGCSPEAHGLAARCDR